MSNPIEELHFSAADICDTCGSVSRFTTGKVYGYVGGGIIALQFDNEPGLIQLRKLEKYLNFEFYENRSRLHKENNNLAQAIGHHIDGKCSPDQAKK